MESVEFHIPTVPTVATQVILAVGSTRHYSDLRLPTFYLLRSNTAGGRSAVVVAMPVSGCCSDGERALLVPLPPTLTFSAVQLPMLYQGSFFTCRHICLISSDPSSPARACQSHDVFTILKTRWPLDRFCCKHRFSNTQLDTYMIM